MLLLFPQEGRVERGVFVLGGTDNRMDAKVVAVGKRVSDAIRVGATVIADRFAGIALGIDGVQYRLVPEAEISAEQELS